MATVKKAEKKVDPIQAKLEAIVDVIERLAIKIGNGPLIEDAKALKELVK